MTNRYGRAIFCAAALVMTVSQLAWAGDPVSIAQDQDEIEILPETSCDYVVAPSSAEVPLPVFVPKLAPGIEFTGGWLFLRPGADNLGFATITTFLPLENPQWAVQTLNPSYQWLHCRCSLCLAVRREGHSVQLGASAHQQLGFHGGQ